MNCPNCHKKINIVEQITEMNEMHYDGVEPPILLMIMCEKCETQSIMVEFIPMGEDDFEEVESPVLGDGVKVKMPKMPEDSQLSLFE